VANTSVLAKRFAELVSQLEAVEATRRYDRSPPNDLFLNWKVKARHLISMACGTESEHYRQFVKCGRATAFGTNFTQDARRLLWIGEPRPIAASR
jgi:hypothetical protein